MSRCTLEIQQGTRFQFGRNWSHFLKVLNEERILEAEKSLCSMLQRRDLSGLRFIDVGCGSGLFSLAARRLGAIVHSFDFDPESVACADEIKRQFFAGDDHWTIGQGSALDADYLDTLGRFDVVYSWGVLHHTGDMWQALANMVPLVESDGRLYVAIYNETQRSQLWKRLKHAYCANTFARTAIGGTMLPYYFTRFAVGSILRGRNLFAEYRQRRGMSPMHDWIDWIGGYPYEFATPGKIVDFYHGRGLQLQRLQTRNTLGCNQFVFQNRKESVITTP